jgi:hypothetical protein
MRGFGESPMLLQNANRKILELARLRRAIPRFAASLPLAGPAAAAKRWRDAPALTGWSWSGALKIAVRSLLPLKKLRGISRISIGGVTAHGHDASVAKVAISKVPSPFALIPKDNLAEATAGLVHERLKIRCRNNHIERTEGAPFILPSKFRPQDRAVEINLREKSRSQRRANPDTVLDCQSTIPLQSKRS